MRAVRLALAQLNVVVGDLAGNVGAHRRRDRGGAAPPGPTSSSSRSSPSPATRPRTCCCDPGSSTPRARRSTRSPAPARDHRARRRPVFDRDLANARLVCADGELQGDLPQALPAELRRLRRAPLLRGRPRAAAARLRRRPRRARRSARTSGSPGRRRPTSRSPARRCIVNLSASPFHVGKAEEREEMLVTRARDNAAYVAFCNLVGGQDELVFDGHSVVLDDEGEVIARAPGLRGGAARRRHRPATRRSAAVSATCAAGSSSGRCPRRRQRRRSALAAPRAVVSRSRADGRPVRARARADAARARARAAGLRRRRTASVTSSSASRAASTRRSPRRSPPTRSAPSACTRSRCRRASPPRGRGTTRARSARTSASTSARSRSRASSAAFHEALGGVDGLAAENLQARIRGSLLMALSNTHGWLVVSTGNKSETAVGYSTIYGDMVGGYALLKDVFKTDVFRLARHLNERAGRELIPVSTIERPPTRRAARRPARRPVAAAVRRARPDPRGVRRARSLARGARSRVRRCARRARAPARRSRRVQAPPGGPRGEAPAPRVRPGLADAHHQPVEGLNARDRSGDVVPGFGCTGALPAAPRPVSD